MIQQSGEMADRHLTAGGMGQTDNGFSSPPIHRRKVHNGRKRGMTDQGMEC